MPSPNHPDGHFYEATPNLDVNLSISGGPYYRVTRDGELYFAALTSAQIEGEGLSHLLPEAQAPTQPSALRVIWQSNKYAPSLVVRRYVKCSSDKISFVWHEVNSEGDTLREGLADAECIPHDPLQLAFRYAGQRFGYVDWPI